MTVHRCEPPAVVVSPLAMNDLFVCPVCRASYVLVYGKRYGFLWRKRDLVWRRLGLS